MNNLAALFYVNNRVQDSSQTARVQEALDVLTGLFHQVGMMKNVYKMVVMVFQPYHTSGIQSKVEYTWWVMGEGLSYRER